MATAAAAATIAGSAIQTGGGIFTARGNRKSAERQQKLALAEARRQQELNRLTAEGAAKKVENSYINAQTRLKDYTTLAQKAFDAGDTRAADIYNQKANDARQTLSAGYSRSRGALQPMANLSHYGEDALTGKGFETSGGYQFRLGEGQSALDRMGASSGGRLSGAALKAASQYNQGFASNEYNNWANRASDLGRVGYNAQGRIADTYGQEGTNLSNIDQNQGSYLSNLYENAGTRAGNLQSNLGTNLSSLITGGATNAANLRTGSSALNTNLTSNMMNAYQQPTGAGSEWKAISDAGGSLAQLGAYAYGQNNNNPGDQTVHWDAATNSWLPGYRG